MILDAQGNPYPRPEPKSTTKSIGYSSLRAALRQGQPGGWATDHRAETDHYVGWNYVAIRALALQAARASVYVFHDDNQKDRNKSYRSFVRKQLGYETIGKAKALLQVEDPALTPLSAGDPLVRLLKRPSPTQSGASQRYEIVMQLSLTGTALIWRVPSMASKYGADKRTVERHVIPTAAATPVPPTPEYPHGGFRIQPLSRGPHVDTEKYTLTQGWMHAIGRTIPADDMLVIRWPHPLYKDDGMSGLSAGSLWTDTAQQVDEARWGHLEFGIDPSVFVSPPKDWSGGAEELQEIQDNLAATYGGAKNAGKAFVVTGDAKPVTTEPAKMAYESAFNQVRDAILAIHGTPPIAAGITEAGAYAAFFAALKQFTELTVQPTLDLIAEEETEQQAPEFGEGLTVEYEASAIDDPAVIETQLANDLQAKTLTKKEWRAKRGMPPFGDERDDELVGEGGQEAEMPGAPGGGEGFGAQSKNGQNNGKPGMKGPQTSPPDTGNLLDGLRMERPSINGKGKTHASQRKSCCAMAMLPHESAELVRAFASTISPDDYCECCEQPDDPHVTVLYGLHKADPEALSKTVAGTGPLGLHLGQLEIFRNLDHDILVAKVKSDKLEELHHRIARAHPHTKTFDTYRPHVTIATLKPGAGEHFEGLDPFGDAQAEVSELLLSDPEGEKHRINVKLLKTNGHVRATDWFDRASRDVLSRFGVEPVENGRHVSEPEDSESIADPFAAAGRYLIEDDNPRIKLYHGTKGGRAHGWIKKGNMVFDGQWQQAKGYNARAQVEYTRQQAVEKMLDTEHFGPWHEEAALV